MSKKGRLWLAQFRALLGWFLVCLAASWNAVAAELPAGDLATILDARSNELVVWRYADNPEIYVFDFPNLSSQGRTFNRITQLTEQQSNGEGYLRVLTADELTRYFESLRRTQADFAFGHDVMIHELALFFNLVERDKIELYPEEVALRDFAVSRGLLRGWRGFYQALKPNAVFLSVPQAQEKRETEPRITIDARYTILSHELSHGEFYSNPFYANYARKFWSETLTDSQREAFKNFLAKYNYAVVAEELLINEMQAYLMFTPDPASFSARKLGVPEEELVAMRDAFRKGKPPTKLPLKWLKGDLQ